MIDGCTIDTMPSMAALQGSGMPITIIFNFAEEVAWRSTTLKGPMIYVKKNATICKICALRFDKKSRHTFMVCAGSAWIQNCGTFCQTRRNLANAHHFHGKKLGLQRFAAQPLKCGAFGGRKAAHMPPRF